MFWLQVFTPRTSPEAYSYLKSNLLVCCWQGTMWYLMYDDVPEVSFCFCWILYVNKSPHASREISAELAHDVTKFLKNPCIICTPLSLQLLNSLPRASKASLEMQKEDFRLPLPLPPVSPAHPEPKSTKMAQKRPRSESGELPGVDNTARSKSSHKDPLFYKHKKAERNHSELSKGIEVGFRSNWQDVSWDPWVLCDSF